MTTENNWIDLNDIQAIAIAQSEGWEVQIDTGPFWEEWNEKAWMSYQRYRGRPRQPKMKEVKIFCYYTSDQLLWIPAELKAQKSWIRQPHLDMIAKVPE